MRGCIAPFCCRLSRKVGCFYAGLLSLFRTQRLGFGGMWMAIKGDAFALWCSRLTCSAPLLACFSRLRLVKQRLTDTLALFCSVVLVRVIGVWVCDFGWRSGPADSNQTEYSSMHDITFELIRQRIIKAHSHIRLCEEVLPEKEAMPEQEWNAEDK